MEFAECKCISIIHSLCFTAGKLATLEKPDSAFEKRRMIVALWSVLFLKRNFEGSQGGFRKQV